jgi:hypothetical protein
VDAGAKPDATRIADREPINFQNSQSKNVVKKTLTSVLGGFMNRLCADLSDQLAGAV